KARKAVELARERLAALLRCEPSEIIFTSGGTESSNAVIHSAVQFEPRGKHLVISSVEHSAVLRPCQDLEKRGCHLTFLGVDRDGNADVGQVEAAIRPETALVSIMWANNETGVLFPVERIAEICHRKGVLFHTDAVQAIGKIPDPPARYGGQFSFSFLAQISWPKRRRRTLCQPADTVYPFGRRRWPGKRAPRRYGKRRRNRRPWESSRAGWQTSHRREMQRPFDA